MGKGSGNQIKTVSFTSRLNQMANISFLHPDTEADEDRYLHHHHHPIQSSLGPCFPTLSSSSSSSSSNRTRFHLHEPADLNIRAFDEFDDVSDPESVILAGKPEIMDLVSRVSFVEDLFQQRREERSQMLGRPSLRSRLLSDSLQESIFGVVEDDSELSIDGLEHDLGRGFQDIDSNESNQDVGRNYSDNIIIDDGDFFDGRRVSEMGSCDTDSAVCFHANPVRVVGFDSDSDSEIDEHGNLLAIDLNSGDEYGQDRVNLGVGSDYGNDCGNTDDNEYGDGDVDLGAVTPLRWDSLRLVDRRESNEDFEWEEVDGRVDEREVLSVFVDDEESASVSLSISPLIAPEDMITAERVGGLGILEWEVLLEANNYYSNLEREQDHNFDFWSEHDGTAEVETLFGQFAENEIAVMSRPPAAKTVVARLPSLILTKEDVDSNSAPCAVCKDDINVGETARRLPCMHWYHGECIMPWLEIRNTCPVCRYELPTDNAEYERKKADQITVAAWNFL